VYKRLVSFIIKVKILTENQYRFQKNKLIITACQSFIGTVQDALDRQSFAVGIFFDLTKAYGVIDHDILLEKLNHYGIRAKINVCLKSYLTLCSQYVEIISNDNKHSMNRYNSTLRNIKLGKPQGSILGLLLFFIIYK
jgi:hypothetical protein